MAKTSKATKKFQGKHLKHTLDHRRQVQRHQKLKGKRGTKEKEEVKPERKSAKDVFDDMSVEQFFDGGFEVPEGKGKPEDSDLSESELESGETEGEIDESEVEGEAEGDEPSGNLESPSGEPSGDEDDSSDESPEQMEHEMAALAEKDPDFHKYLQDNDKELLDFKGVNPMDAMSDSEGESEGESEGPQTAALKTLRAKIDITKAHVTRWNKQLDNPTIRVIQNVVAAFKAAVNIHSSEDVDTRYTVTDPSVFADLMFVGLQRVPEAVHKLSPYKTNAKGNRAVDEKNEHTHSVARVLKSQAGAYITLLADITNTETAALVLSSLQEVLPFYVSYRKIMKQIINAVVTCWATTPHTDTQVATYAFLNNAAREFPRAVLEMVLRGCYTSFLKTCRRTNPHTMDLINFCKNSAAELFAVDESLSYAIGFEYVRQLAIHLRTSMTAASRGTDSKNPHLAVYNWQFCHSLDFWSRVVAQHCVPEKEGANHKSGESPLRALIYPLVQVTLGTIRLVPTPQYFPLRFYLVRSLMRISQNTEVYIPVFPLVMEILTSSAFTKVGKPASLPAFDFDHNIKAGLQYLGTKPYQDGLCGEFLDLTAEFFALHCKSIAFPELVTPAVISLRRFAKSSKLFRFNKQVHQLVEKLNQNATFITEKRQNVSFGPSNRAMVAAFLKDVLWESTPVGKYVVVLRKQREETRRLLKEALENEKRGYESEESIDLE